MQIDHIQLAMPEGKEDLARSFFVGVLGMDEDPKPSPLDARGGVWFRSGTCVLHLGIETDFQPQKKAHPAFLIQDLDALADVLAKANHEVIWDTALPDRRRFYSADPFGNRLEFIEDGSGFSQEA